MERNFENSKEYLLLQDDDQSSRGDDWELSRRQSILASTWIQVLGSLILISSLILNILFMFQRSSLLTALDAKGRSKYGMSFFITIYTLHVLINW
jgi:hypothetical protein